MAKAEVTKLYAELVSSEFDFVPRGHQHIDRIYLLVKEKYLDLCDDDYLCSMNCESGHDRPEWQHAVRRALEALKKKQLLSVKHTGRKYYWSFV